MDPLRPLYLAFAGLERLISGVTGGIRDRKLQALLQDICLRSAGSSRRNRGAGQLDSGAPSLASPARTLCPTSPLRPSGVRARTGACPSRPPRFRLAVAPSPCLVARALTSPRTRARPGWPVGAIRRAGSSSGHSKDRTTLRPRRLSTRAWTRASTASAPAASWTASVRRSPARSASLAVRGAPALGAESARPGRRGNGPDLPLEGVPTRPASPPAPSGSCPRPQCHPTTPA
jgi:hypothetical protein